MKFIRVTENDNDMTVHYINAKHIKTITPNDDGGCLIDVDDRPYMLEVIESIEEILSRLNYYKQL